MLGFFLPRLAQGKWQYMEYLSSLWSAVWGSTGSVPAPVPEPVPEPAVAVPEPVVPEPEVQVAATAVPAARKRTRNERRWQKEHDEDQGMALLDEFYWRGRNGGLTSTIPTAQYDVDEKPLERQRKHRDRIHARDFRQKYPVKKRFELSEHRQRYHRPPKPFVPDHIHITDEFRQHHNLFLGRPVQVKKDRYAPRAAEKQLIAQNFL